MSLQILGNIYKICTTSRASHLGQLCHVQDPPYEFQRFSKNMVQQLETRFSRQL
jgi:hypothetical protein